MRKTKNLLAIPIILIMILQVLSFTASALTPAEEIAEFIQANPEKKEVTSLSAVGFSGWTFNPLANLTDNNYSSYFLGDGTMPMTLSFAFSESLIVSDIFVYLDLTGYARYSDRNKYGPLDDFRYIKIYTVDENDIREERYDCGFNLTEAMIHITNDKPIKQVLLVKPTVAESTGKPADDTVPNAMAVNEVKLFAKKSDHVSTKNVAQNMPVSFASDVTFYPGHSENQLVDGIDINSDTNNFTYVNEMKDAYLLVDLLNTHDVETIQVVARSNYWDANDLSDIDVLGSSELVPISQMEKLGSYSGVPAGQTANIKLTNGKRYRYIALLKTTTSAMCISELRVFAKVTEQFDRWRLMQGYTEVTGIVAGSSYTVNTSVINYVDVSKPYYLIVSAYDENDAIMHIWTKKITCLEDTKTTVELPVTLPEGTKRLSAVLYHDIANPRMVIDPANYTVEGYTKPELSAELENGKIIINFSRRSGEPPKRFGVFVTKPGYSVTNAMNDDDLRQAICYADTVSGLKAGEEKVLVYKVPRDATFGKYLAKVSTTNEDGSAADYSQAFYNFSEADMNACVDAFKAVDASNFFAVVSQYTNDQTPMVSKEHISELEVVADALGESFVKARSAFAQGMLSDSLTDIRSIEDVNTVVKLAVVFYALSQQNEGLIASACAKYGRLAPKIFNEKLNYNTFANLAKNAIFDLGSEEFSNQVRFYNALSIVNNDTNADIAYALQNYSEEIGYDKAKVVEYKLDYLEIAQRIRGKGCNESNLRAMVNGAIDDLIKAKTKAEPKPVKSRSGDAITGMKVGPIPTDQTVSATSQDSEPNMPFSDLSGVPWAVNAIETLYNKGVIAGVGNRQFNPDSLLKREEFVKLLVLAFDVKSDSGAALQFNDCSMDDWYYPYVSVAYANGLVSGMSESRFGAGESIVRQDIAVMIAKLIQSKKIIVNNIEETVFSDSGQIDDYAKKAMDMVCGIGIIKGFADGSCRPKEGTSRAEAAVIIDRLLKFLAKGETK